MQATSRGFTIAELVVTIIILGVISAFAVSRYINLTSSARQKSTDSVAAALAAASANNFAARSAGGTGVGSQILNCTSIGNLLSGGLPSDYSIQTLTITAGGEAQCTLTGAGGTTANFRGLGIN